MSLFNLLMDTAKTGNSSGGSGEKVPPLGDLGFIWNVGQVSISSLFWPQVFKSSECDWATTTKPYFVLYSTDHDPGAGGIYWGEMDTPFFTGFVERGLIWEGNQTETPYIVIVPSGESAITDKVFLYFHTSQNTQMTRLITSNGGVLHEANWTDRGAFTQIQSGDTHLGYAKIYRRGANDYVAIHKVASGGVEAVSYASDPADLFTRQYIIDQENLPGIPSGNDWSVDEGRSFPYNGEWYYVGFRRVSGEEIAMSLFKATPENDFLPTEYIGDITPAGAEERSMGCYIEGNYLYVYIKEGGVGQVDNDKPYRGYNIDMRTFLNAA